MKITINSRVLKSALESTAKAISPKPTIPSLANFLLEGNGNYLTITGSDGNTTIKETIPCETEGKALLPTNLLELVRTLTEGDITIETDTTTAKILWTNGQSTIPCYNHEEYPEIFEYKGEYLAIKGAALADAVNFTIPHTADDDLRPVMAGIFFNGKNNRTIEIVASDARTLAIHKVASEHSEPFNFIVPASAMKFVANLAKVADVEFVADAKNVYFKAGATQVITRRIEGRFPNYESIIPTSFVSSLTMDKQTLCGSIRRVLVCASKASGHIKLNLGILENTIAAEDTSLGTSSKELLEGASFDGADFTIGFKGDLLLKSVSSFPDDEVKINFVGASNAAVLKSEDESALVLVMPVQIA